MATKVTEGQVVQLMTGPSHHQELAEYTIGPKCDKPDMGRWICVTHDKVFANNWEKDSHVSGKCQMAWFCAYHGPEVP
jgi:hypothetical protein